MLKFLLPSFYLFPFFHLSSNVMLRKITVKDYTGTTAPRVLKFGTNIGYNYLYCIRDIQHPHFYHSLCPFFFLQIKFFVTGFSATASPRILKLGTNIGCAQLYFVKEIQHPHACHSLYLSIFLSFLLKFVTDSSPAIRARV